MSSLLIMPDKPIAWSVVFMLVKVKRVWSEAWSTACVWTSRHMVMDRKASTNYRWAPDAPLTDTSKSKVEGKRRHGHHLSFILPASFVFLSLALPLSPLALPSVPLSVAAAWWLRHCRESTSEPHSGWVIRQSDALHLKSFFSFFIVFFLPAKT